MCTTQDRMKAFPLQLNVTKFRIIFALSILERCISIPCKSIRGNRTRETTGRIAVLSLKALKKLTRVYAVAVFCTPIGISSVAFNTLFALSILARCIAFPASIFEEIGRARQQDRLPCSRAKSPEKNNTSLCCDGILYTLELDVTCNQCESKMNIKYYKNIHKQTLSWLEAMGFVKQDFL